MANEIYSKDLGVYVDVSETETPTWRLAVCTTTKSLSISTGSTELNNDCSGNFSRNLPSTVSWTMAFEGDTNSAPGVNEVSTNDLFSIATSREVRKWKIESGDLTYVRYGEAFISQMDEAASAPDYQTFSITLTGSGEILDSEPS